MFLSFHHLQKDKQRKQRHSLCEARQEKTREFQTQLLHYFSKSDNKSNHHYHRERTEENRHRNGRCHGLEEARKIPLWISLKKI